MPKIDVEKLQHKIEFIKLVGEYTTLTQHGKSWKGICPFHEERTASFSVTGNMWHCFGCGAKGVGAIRFVMDCHKLDFRKACEWLAQWAGIQLPLNEQTSQHEKSNTRKMNIPDEYIATPSLTNQKEKSYNSIDSVDQKKADELARWQTGCILLPYHRDGNPAAQPGQDYLRLRGISQLFAVCSGVTFHPNWNGHARVVFPIMSKLQATDTLIIHPNVAIEGRAITPGASKLDRLRCAGEKSKGAFWTPGAWGQDMIIFTEGEIEALTFAECGFPAVATCGAGNKPDWLGEMSKGHRVVIAFDEDISGENGAYSLANMMRESGVTEIDWLLPPEIHHPDGKAFDWNDCLCEYGRREVRIRIMEQLTMVT